MQGIFPIFFDKLSAKPYNRTTSTKEAMLLKSQPPRQRIGYYPEAEIPAPQRPVQREKSPKSPLLRLGLMALCVCVFIGSATLLVRYFSNIAASRRASRQMEEIYTSAVEQSPLPSETPAAALTPKPTVVPAVYARPARPSSTEEPDAAELWPTSYPNNPSLRVSSVFYELQRQNPDIVGWLKIEGVLEEPVLQRDNQYYLTHNALQQRSVTGALFLDESIDLTKAPAQMVIHGHNMKEGAMFGALKKYKVKDASFYRAHPFIDFNTIYENARYVIFAVAEVDIRPGKVDHLPFWYRNSFSSVDVFEEYIRDARALSHYRCNVEVNPGDRLLVLATCTGNDDNKRLIVMARKIRDHENELELQMSILSTSDRT